MPAQRAGKAIAGRLARDFDAVSSSPGIENGVAIVALVALRIRLERDRSAAGGTVHWAFPHSAQNLARAGMGLPHSMQNLVSVGRGQPATGPAQRREARPRRLQRRRKHLRNRRARAQPHAHAGAAAGVGRRQVQRLSRGVLRVAAHIAHHAHADALIEDLRSSSGSEMFSTTKLVQFQAQRGKGGLDLLGDLIGKQRPGWRPGRGRRCRWWRRSARCWPRIVSRNWPSRSRGKVDVARAAHLVEEDARDRRCGKSRCRKQRSRTAPNSLSRMVIGVAVPHFWSICRRVEKK